MGERYEAVWLRNILIDKQGVSMDLCGQLGVDGDGMAHCWLV